MIGQRKWQRKLPERLSSKNATNEWKHEVAGNHYRVSRKHNDTAVEFWA
jgi:hypothetical protein